VAGLSAHSALILFFLVVVSLATLPAVALAKEPRHCLCAPPVSRRVRSPVIYSVWSEGLRKKWRPILCPTR
jgi:hypothetical protein